jgi:hypothetical protein
MKKLLFVFSLLTVLISTASLPASAASGKATVPPGDYRYFGSTSYHQLMYFVSNITSNPITVKITLYNNAGSIVTTGFTASPNLTNVVVNPGDSSVSFTLAANATGYLMYNTSSLDWGYAIIAWTQDGSVPYGLIADVAESLTINNTWTARTLAVNNGLPF